MPNDVVCSLPHRVPSETHPILGHRNYKHNKIPLSSIFLCFSTQHHFLIAQIATVFQVPIMSSITCLLDGSCHNFRKLDQIKIRKIADQMQGFTWSAMVAAIEWSKCRKLMFKIEWYYSVCREGWRTLCFTYWYVLFGNPARMYKGCWSLVDGFTGNRCLHLIPTATSKNRCWFIMWM